MALVRGIDRARAAGGSAPIAVALLVAANLIPLIGVLILDWDVLTVLVLYWLENGIIGFFNALRIARADGLEPDPERTGRGWRVTAGSAGRAALVGFFALHYGLFWVVHGVFVFALPAFTSAGFGAYEQFSVPAVVLGAAALAISHGASYTRNFIGHGEYRRVSPRAQFAEPYPRLIVLHITILAGAWALIAAGQPVALVALLVALKTIVDLALHLRRHRRLHEQPARAAT